MRNVLGCNVFWINRSRPPHSPLPLRRLDGSARGSMIRCCRPGHQNQNSPVRPLLSTTPFHCLPSVCACLLRLPLIDLVSTSLLQPINCPFRLRGPSFLLPNEVPLRLHRRFSIYLFTDNVAARSWLRKGSRTTLGPAAYLLRLLALHQRHFRYHSTADYIPGPINQMADDASRLLSLSDAALLSHFNSNYPQAQPWTLSPLRPEMLSALITALQCKRSAPALYLQAPNPATLTGFDGNAIAQNWISLRRSTRPPTRSPLSRSLPIVTAPESYPPAVALSDLAQWKLPSGPLARRFPAWGPRTLV